MGHLTAFGAAVLISILSAATQRGVKDAKRFEEFVPVSDVEWQLQAPPGSGGEHALILSDSAIFDDSDPGYGSFSYSRYSRVRVVDQTGLDEFRTVEIQYFKGSDIENLSARTVKQDGTVVPLDDSDIHEKTVVSLGRNRLEARVFAFKGAEPGDVLEYFYTIRQDYMFAPFALLQNDVYTAHASVLWWYLSPPNFGNATNDIVDQYTWRPAWIVPNGKSFRPLVEERGEPGKANRLSLEIRDVPALPKEPYMPATSEIAVSFTGYYVYPRLDAKKPYWDRTAQELGDATRSFQKKRSRLDPWMADIIGRPRDLDADLKGCFDRIHRDVRNLNLLDDYELPPKLEERNSIDDVLKRGYGASYEINRLLVTMLQRLGYTATLFWSRDRDVGTFIPDWKTVSQLGMSGVAVKTEKNGVVYCVPALPEATPAMVPWEICGTVVLLENPTDGRSVGPFPSIDRIPMAEVDGNESRLGVRVRPDEEGRLSGRLTATWNMKNDPFFKHEIAKTSIKSRKEAFESIRKLIMQPGLKWRAFDESLAIDEMTISYACSLEVDGLVEEAGAARLCDLGSIRSDDYSIPEGPRATNIDFHRPRRITTNVTLVRPDGFEASDLAEPVQAIENYAEFRQWLTLDDGDVTLHREILLPHCAYKAESAGLFRAFFLQVRRSGGQPIVLRRTGTR